MDDDGNRRMVVNLRAALDGQPAVYLRMLIAKADEAASWALDKARALDDATDVRRRWPS